MRKTLLNPVLGQNLEDLRLELECKRSARQPKLLNSVLGKTLKTAHTNTCNWNVNGLLQEVEDCGHFSNCSASCGSQSVLRCVFWSSSKILGTSITCSASSYVRKNWKTSISWGTTCSTGASRAWTSSYPMPLCRSTFPCGQGSNMDAGHVPAVGLPASDESSKYPAGPTPVWDIVASTAAIDCCSRRHQLPPPHRGSTVAVSYEPPARVRLEKKVRLTRKVRLSELVVVVVVVVVVVFDAFIHNVNIHNAIHAPQLPATSH